MLTAVCGLAIATAVAANPALWFDAARPSAEARQAVALLAAAADDGLDPQDYSAAELRGAIDGAATGAALEAPDARRLDDALTAAMLRYLSDLHYGRIDPRRLHPNYALPPRDRFDARAVLAEALAGRRLADAVRAAAPQLPLYGHLRAALAGLRELGDHPAWSAALPLPAGRKLEPGQLYAGLAQLTQRLQALGDLAAGAAGGSRYEGALVEAVRTFQSRHGLAVDGIVGPATLAQLNVAPAQRVRQIELTLERLRWTPLLSAPRMIVVNIPEFVLRAYETHGHRVDVKAEMKIIVGRALDTRTPLFSEDMRFIEFSPYWNIPRSIASQETVPRLRRDPAFFDDQGFEFVGRDGRVSTGLTGALLDAVLHGEQRIRQRPGPKNALGDIKFIFPNNAHIFLHHTPATQLFARDRRDFSHGCIRVEDPVALARFVLEDEAGWTDERIREAMAQGRSSTLRLRQPLPVLIAYGTSLVKQGRIHFFADIYGHDRLLDDALRRQVGRHAGWPPSER